MGHLIKKMLGRGFKGFMLEVITRCNHDCLHCYNIWKNYPDYPKGELSTERTKELIDIMTDSIAMEQIGITGGEPTLRNDLEELISHAKSKKVLITLLTNGSLLDEARTGRLIDAGIDMIQLPILGGVARVHDKMSSNESFNNVIRIMKYAKKRGIGVAGVFVITKENLESLKRVIEICVGLEIDTMLLNRIAPTGRSVEHFDALKLTKKDLEGALDIADSSIDKYGIQISLGTTIQPCIIDPKRYKNLTFPLCPAGKVKGSYYTVDPLGNLRICNVSPEIIGNLFETPFWKLHKSAKVKNFVKARPKICDPCPIRDKCQGGCKACAQICYGDLWEAEPFLKENIGNMDLTNVRV